MNHLSEQEVFDHLDRRLGVAANDVSLHIAECPLCAARIDVARAIMAQAAHAETGIVSKNFTKNIMREIHASKRAPRFAWLVENSANLFAMVFVVGIVACIIYVAASSSPDAGDSIYARQFTLWHDAYVSVMNSITAHNRGSLLPATESTDSFGSVFWMGAAALVVLGFLDKLRTFSRTTRVR